MNNNEKYRKKLIQVILLLCAFLFIFLIVLASLNAKNKEKEQARLGSRFLSIQEILEYYGCKYIREKTSELEGFSLDVYTTFKLDLYTNDESNEDFYNNIINEIADFINYKSFRLIDENKDSSKEDKIEIQVICDGSKIKTIFINGIEDYFIYMDSQIALKKYKDLKITDISVQSPELLSCIQNNWNTDTNFGSRESIFQDYYIYFDEGIEVRKISGKIYNVVFTKKYENPVVNGFTVGTESDIIISRIGTPTFQSSDGNIIGYKGKDIYVFFEKNQISIYRNTEESGFDEFFKLVDQFLNDEYTFLEFMNELTYIWPDYEEYIYDENAVFISYPNKGLDIKLNYENISGIILYNNIGVSQDVANKYLKNTEFLAQLQLDNIYNAEARRVNHINSFEEKCNEYQEKYESEDNRNRGNIYDYYMKMSNNGSIMCTYFISQDEQYTNCELSENIDSYIWINEYCFIYSISGKGLYYYDLKNQVRGVLVTSSDDFEIHSYENGILSYDEKEIELRY